MVSHPPFSPDLCSSETHCILDLVSDDVTFDPGLLGILAGNHDPS